jgi:hypothetical protein
VSRARDWLDRRRRPRPMGDHTLDWTAEDIINPWPSGELPPDVVQLAAMLTGLTPERRLIFSEAVSGNGWPAWLGRWVERYGDWQTFQAMAEGALSDFHEHDISIEASVLSAEQDRKAAA